MTYVIGDSKVGDSKGWRESDLQDWLFPPQKKDRLHPPEKTKLVTQKMTPYLKGGTIFGIFLLDFEGVLTSRKLTWAVQSQLFQWEIHRQNGG